MPRAGPKQVAKHSLEFKLMAVRLSKQPGMQVQAVAHALNVSPVHVVAVAEGSA